MPDAAVLMPRVSQDWDCGGAGLGCGLAFGRAFWAGRAAGFAGGLETALEACLGVGFAAGLETGFGAAGAGLTAVFFGADLGGILRINVSRIDGRW